MNTIDIVGMANRKVPKDKESRDRLEKNLYFYIKIAKKLIFSIAPRFGAGLAEELINNEDAISNIATQIMFGDWKWNKTGTLEGYRKQCAIWAIQSYISRNINKHRNISLNYNIDDEGHELGDIIETTELNPCLTTEKNEIIEKQSVLIDELLGSGVLTISQEQCIRMYYLEGQSLKTISNKLHISREAVRQLVDRGIHKLQTLVKESEYV